MLYAHYSNGSNGTRILRITRDIEGREIVQETIVSGKREARVHAYMSNAKCWNF